MPKKYYGVKNGHQPGVYETWEECRNQVHGFSGASFKGFPTRKEAELFCGLTAGAESGEEVAAGAESSRAEFAEKVAIGEELGRSEPDEKVAASEELGRAESDEKVAASEELGRTEFAEKVAVGEELGRTESDEEVAAGEELGRAEPDEKVAASEEIGRAESDEAGDWPFTDPKGGKAVDSEHLPTSEGGAIAYVDGSYDDSIKAFAYGVVLFHNGREEHFSAKMDDPELVEMRNVAGEIKAAEAAMQYCIDHNIKSIHIYHDYEGIAKWCTGEWRANKIGTKAYRAFYQRIQPRLKVRFIKVKGHSGDQYNDVADQLAKSALGIGKQPKGKAKAKVKVKV